MELSFRPLEEKDLEILIAMRIEQLLEEGAKAQIDLSPHLWDYYRRHFEDGSFVGWLALDGDKIVGTSGLSFVEKPPYFGNPSGKIGLLSSMYTVKEYRRQGIARRLLGKIVQEARKKGCGAIQITASEMGALLYRDFGFQQNQNFFQLIL